MEEKIEKMKIDEYRNLIEIKPIPKDGLIVSLETVIGSDVVAMKKIYLSDIHSSWEGNEWISPPSNDEEKESYMALEYIKTEERFDPIVKEYVKSYITLRLLKSFISSDGIRVSDIYSIIIDLENSLIVTIPIYLNPFPEFVSD
ncbi:MAG: hypothetical protein QW745_06975 [Thermoplasmata archaeon]